MTDTTTREDEIVQARLDILDAVGKVGLLMSTGKGINEFAEAQRQKSIERAWAEIARMERNLLELRREA